jgi:AcrR family transcriptional regulator
MKADPPSARRARKGTAEKLVRAAASEFNEHGFLGTDTNRIARRAGFAPQTFYRWFGDKTEIFVKVYERWQQEEASMLQRLLAKDASDARLVQAVVTHHRRFRIFRRSLRQMSIEDDVVRKARAESRLNQIAQIRKWNPAQPASTADLAVALFKVERLADALAEGEFDDMGIDRTAGETELGLLINWLRSPRKIR